MVCWCIIMAAKASTIMFEYIAHVSKEDGGVVELAGTREDESHNTLYQWLLGRAAELGGWLISQHINEAGTDSELPWKVDQPDTAQKALPAPPMPKLPTVFDNREVFGIYSDTYKGATSITYKVTGD